MAVPTPITNAIRRANFHHLYADTAWLGLLFGSALSFINVYAARLGASSLQIGLLSAGPAIINLLFSLPAGRWLERRPLISITFITSLAQRLGYLLLIPLPVLFLPQTQIWTLVLLTLLMSVPGTLLAIAFNAMFADIVPPEMRAQVVGWRNVLSAIAITVTALFCGYLLDNLDFPLNYQVVFGIGVLGALMSSYHLGRLRDPGGTPPPRIGRPLGDLVRPGMGRFVDAVRQAPGLRFLTRSGGQPLFRLGLLRGPFGRFMLAYLAFYSFQYFALPLFPLFFVEEIHLTDGEISVGTALFHLVVVLGSLRLSQISARFGHRRVLVFGGVTYSIYPLILALATDARLYWLASLLGGGVLAMLNGGIVNRLMERVPEDDRPAHMALHNLVLNLGILLGSLLGPLAGDWLGLRDALWLGAGLRVLGGILILLWA